MQACPGEKCETEGIPVHLHTNGMTPVDRIEDSDLLYMRHPHQEDSFGFKFEYRPVNQSANSASLNPNGQADDVRYDTTTGEKDDSVMVVTLPVSEIRAMKFPNPNLLNRKDKNQQIIPPREEDNFYFDAVHDPTPCMYPHCEISTMQEGKRLSKVSDGMRRYLRSRFGGIAEKFRQEK